MALPPPVSPKEEILSDDSADQMDLMALKKESPDDDHQVQPQMPLPPPVSPKEEILSDDSADEMDLMSFKEESPYDDHQVQPQRTAEPVPVRLVEVSTGIEVHYQPNFSSPDTAEVSNSTQTEALAVKEEPSDDFEEKPERCRESSCRQIPPCVPDDVVATCGTARSEILRQECNCSIEKNEAMAVREDPSDDFEENPEVGIYKTAGGAFVPQTRALDDKQISILQPQFQPLRNIYDSSAEYIDDVTSDELIAGTSACGQGQSDITARCVPGVNDTQEKGNIEETINSTPKLKGPAKEIQRTELGKRKRSASETIDRLIKRKNIKDKLDMVFHKGKMEILLKEREIKKKELERMRLQLQHVKEMYAIKEKIRELKYKIKPEKYNKLRRNE